ncbi:hypothetical protein D3C84_1094460 [compost metagenome]
MHIDAIQRDTETFELVALGRRHAARPVQHQIRAHAEQALHVQLAIAANQRHVFQLRRPFVPLGHAHQQIAGLQVENDFSDRRRQADHSRRCRQWHAEGQQQQPQVTAHQPSWRGIR